jgi:hypothetical protein
MGSGLNRNTDNTVGYLTLDGGANFRVQDRHLRFLIFSATFLIIFYSRLDAIESPSFCFSGRHSYAPVTRDETNLVKFFIHWCRRGESNRRAILKSVTY